jgi:hypothetical protein
VESQGKKPENFDQIQEASSTEVASAGYSQINALESGTLAVGKLLKTSF